MTGHAAEFDVIIIGAGAAGLFCAAETARRGRRTLLLDHAAKPGEKIRISGGGRCNFTNLHSAPEAFLSDNPRFCISALTRYDQHDFIALMEAHGIGWREKTRGQLFCDGRSGAVIEMLLTEMRDAGAALRLSSSVETIERAGEGFRLSTKAGPLDCAALVIVDRRGIRALNQSWCSSCFMTPRRDAPSAARCWRGHTSVV